MVILGLTGSIGMGKTTVAGMFRRHGVPVHDADQTVHRLLGPAGAAVAAVARTFGSDLIGDAGIDRQRLGALVFQAPDALTRLEAILHPLVRQAERRFLATAGRARARMVVLDVPLLFETGGAGRVDGTVVVTAPPLVQRARVLARPGMTPERLARILTLQLPDREKRALADYVIQTGLGKPYAWAAVSDIIRDAAKRRGRRWPARRDPSSWRV